MSKKPNRATSQSNEETNQDESTFKNSQKVTSKTPKQVKQVKKSSKSVSSNETPKKITTKRARSKNTSSGSPSQIEGITMQSKISASENTAQSSASTAKTDNTTSRTVSEYDSISTEQIVTEIQAAEAQASLPEPSLTKQKSTKNIFQRMYQAILRPFAPTLPLNKIILPDEKVIESTLIIYFTELQIALGVLSAVLGFILIYLGYNFLLSIPVIVIGMILIFTGSGSEEAHVTNLRILIRKLNLVDRIFRIPKDEQYLLRQVVSFQIGRAPINRVLAFLSILTIILAGLGIVSVFPSTLMVITAILTFIFSLRLFKCSLTFSMSGGNNVTIGIYKGVPRNFIERFVETALSVTLQP